jgi:hypothetical protein
MKLETTEKFPHLPKAPIVEAVINFRAKPTAQCEQKQFEEYFKAQFQGFPAVQIHNQVNYQLKLGAADSRWGLESNGYFSRSNGYFRASNDCF